MINATPVATRLDRHVMRHLLASCAFACVLVGNGAAAQAQATETTPAPTQEAPAAQSESDHAAPPANEIIVTARRTEERLSRVPVSVSAIGSAQLEERRITTEADLQSATAGLTVRQTNSSNQVNFSLRGQSLDAFSFAAPAVLTYVNEFNAQGVAASAFYDLQSVQVLKGPQGTLFGRNATGGAVLYSTQKPESDFGGYGKISYGNFNAVTAEGAINIPFGGDAGGFRLASFYQRRDGYQHNLLLGTTNASIDTFSIRPTLTVRSGAFESTTMFQYTFSGGVSAGLKGDVIYAPGQTNNGYLLSPGVPSGAIYVPGSAVIDPRVAALGFNGIFDYLNKQKSYGFYDIFNNQDGLHRGRQFLVTNTSVYDLNDDLRVKNVIGYNYSKSRDHTDVDGTPYEPLTIGYAAGTAADGYIYVQHQFSEELQLSGKAFQDKVDFLFGGFYFTGLDHQRLPLCIGCDLAGGPLAVFLREYETQSYSKAAYAQATYHITDRLNFTAGGRYTWELTKFRPAAQDIGALSGVKPAQKSDSKPSWTFSLDYRPTDTLLLYVAQRGSWRTGGYNGTATDIAPGGGIVVNSFGPETTYDFEVGAKFNGEIGTMPTTLNVAVYDQHIRNVIRAVYLGVSAVSGNARRARVTGVEADASIRPSNWLQVGGTLAYTNARYTDPIATVGGQSVTFGPYGDVPEWSGSAFFRAASQVGDLGEAVFRGDFYAQSKFYYTNAAATIIPGTVIRGYHLVDARLELNKISGSRVSVAAFVKNLTDEKYNVGGFGLGAVVGINALLPGVPRTYGIEASFKF